METTPQSDGTPMPITIADAATFWRNFGFEPGKVRMLGGLPCILPENVIVFSASSDHHDTLAEFVKALGYAPSLVTTVRGRRHYFYRTDVSADLDATKSPADITLHVAGQTIALPEDMDFQPSKYVARSIDDLTLILPEDFPEALKPKERPAIVDSPFDKFSLLGMAETFERNAVEATPILGNLCMAGQATVFYAPPNAGKTLITLKLLMDAVAEKRINPANTYYINADDSSEGFAMKIRLMDDLGVHTLAPGHKKFRAEDLPGLFHSVAEAKKARGALVIIDTMKKVASLMDKGKVSDFTSACRLFVMSGGTIVGFAHTNKSPKADGSLQYGGTTDVRDDFDAAYIMAPMDAEDFPDEKIVQFSCIKRRGSNMESVAYVYADTDGISYPERLASVRMLARAELDGFKRAEVEKADSDIVEAIIACILESEFAKMQLGREVAQRTGISERAAIRTLEAYTGTDPTKHRWNYVRRSRGAKIYTILPPAGEDAQQLAA